MTTSDDAPPPEINRLANLPRDIVTHHLIPQFTAPAVLLLPDTAPRTAQSVPSAGPLLALSQTSRHLRALVAAEYSTYCQHQYPALYARTIQAAAATATALSSIDWRGKILQAERLCNRWSKLQVCISLAATGDAAGPDVRRRRSPYAAAVDVHEALDGRETLVVGRGTSLAVRTDGTWRSVTREGMAYGADDYVAVHALDEDTVVASRSLGVELVTGVRDGEELRVAAAEDLFAPSMRNPTSIVTSSCLDVASRSLAVTCSSSSIDKHELQLFSVRPTDAEKTTFAPTVTSSIPSKPWCSTFLSPTTVATGHRTGLTLHTTTPAGSAHAVELPQPETSYVHDLSVNSVTPLSPPFSPCLLATGWSDGCVRLVDTRTRGYTATFTETVTCEAVPVYSLLHTSPLSNALLAASSQNHKLMLYDLRYADADAAIAAHSTGGTITCATGTMPQSVVLFFDKVAASVGGRGRGRRQFSSAMYALAAPPSSARVYIGAEDAVVSMDFSHSDGKEKLAEGETDSESLPVLVYRSWAGDSRAWGCAEMNESRISWWL
ncbi:hypothetical protein Dda_6862 [Drechslerella dactyloides]|uniref:Uncharacterized protein n=1 Tax=Drechslerella dactyloides TaxID=74499 RepID=A0AAD6IUG7_DREDA|nr:hypothetical protein Dda_6862 [Drechslerella dactyloides]